MTLVTSAVMKRELAANKCAEERIQVWQRGVDTSVFHPKYRSASFAVQHEMCCSIVRSRQMTCPVWPDLLVLQRHATPCQLSRCPAYLQLFQASEVPSCSACSLLQMAFWAVWEGSYMFRPSDVLLAFHFRPQSRV